MVTLELNEQQARLLRDVMDRIGGTQESRRRYADEIAGMLDEAGFGFVNDEFPDVSEDNRAIYFKDTEDD